MQLLWFRECVICLGFAVAWAPGGLISYHIIHSRHGTSGLLAGGKVRVWTGDDACLPSVSQVQVRSYKA